MNKKIKSLISDTLIFGLGGVGSKLIVFFLVPLYTSVLTTEEYGMSELVFTFSELLMPTMCLAIYNAIIRFGLENKEHPENALFCGMFVWFVGCVVSVVLIPLLDLYRPIADWKWYLVLHVNASIVLSISQNYLKVKGYNLRYSIISILQTALLAGLNILLLLVFKLGIQGYLLSNAIACLLSALLAIAAGNIIVDLRKSKLDKNLLVEMVKYSAPLILNNIAWWVIQSSDKVMIEMFAGSAALGLYTVAARIPSFVNIVVNIFQQAWGISSIVEMDSTNDNEFYSEVFNAYVFVTCGASIFINALIKPFMKIYVSDEFYPAWKLAPLLVVSAAAFSAVAAFYGSMYGALKKSLNNMLTTLLGALVNIIMNYVFIRTMGAMGAVIGTIIAYFILALARMIDVNRYIKICVNYRTYGLNCLLITLQGVLVTSDYHIGLVSAISCVLFAIVNRAEILMLAGKIKDCVTKKGQ